MPEKTLNEVFSEIADAIRDKSESSETIKPINMAAAIEEIPTGPQFESGYIVTTGENGSVYEQPAEEGFYISKPSYEYAGDSSDINFIGTNSGAGIYYFDGAYDSTSALSPLVLTNYSVYQYYGGSDFTEIDTFPPEYGWYYYGVSGDNEFSRVKLADGLYQILGSNDYPINLTANNYYQYTVTQGQMEFIPYTPQPTGEKGKYYYGNGPTAQTLNNDTLYYKSYNSNEALVTPSGLQDDGYYEYMGGSHFWNLQLEDTKFYSTSLDSHLAAAIGIDATVAGIYSYDGDGTFTTYTPQPAGEKGKYYYGNGPTAQTLSTGCYQFIDNNSALVTYTPPSIQAGTYYYDHNGVITEQQPNSYLLGNNFGLDPLEELEEGLYVCGSANYIKVESESEEYGYEYDPFQGWTLDIDRSAAAGESGDAYYDGIYTWFVNSSDWHAQITKQAVNPYTDGYYFYNYENGTLTPYTPTGSGEPGKYYYDNNGTVTEQALTINHMYFSTGHTDALATVSTTAAEWDGNGHLFAMNIDRSAAEGESGFEYYEGIYSYVLNSSDWSVDLVKLKLTAGSTYTWNGHSFIPYTPESDLDALMQEVF